MPLTHNPSLIAPKEIPDNALSSLTGGLAILAQGRVLEICNTEAFSSRSLQRLCLGHVHSTSPHVTSLHPPASISELLQGASLHDTCLSHVGLYLGKSGRQLHRYKTVTMLVTC
jgi:hypothetical protein